VFTEDELARSLAPLGEATMLPAVAYTSPEVLAWELRHLFAGTWTCLGRRADLFAGGVTQRAVLAGDVSVLVTQRDGQVAALANTCRHRGHELLFDGVAAGRDAVVCPYHAWTYRLDGTLRGAPGLSAADGLDLVRLPVAVWHDWVFVNALGDTGFDEHVGAMAELVAPYGPERLALGARHDYTVAANWKVIAENYHECYHCPMIHPELCAVSPPASGDNYDLPGAWVGGSMELREHAETMSLDGRSSGVFIAGVDRRRVLYLGLLPNLLVSAHPDYVMTHLLWPLAPDRTRVECSWYVPAGGDAAHAVEFWDRTNRQDWAACESVQRGLASPHFRPGPFTAREDAVHRWVTMIAGAYRAALVEVNENEGIRRAARPSTSE
jgi:Rieske 2Fe-2S family protein